MKRSEIKDVHELSVLTNFTNYCAASEKEMVILEKPEPPDAIITINGDKTWIEITDAFYSNKLAESITSYVASDKKHKLVSKRDRCSIDPDEKFSDIIRSVILKKYEKNSIKKIYNQYGAGILLVGIITPFSGAQR